MKKNNQKNNLDRDKLIVYFLSRQFGTLVKYEELQKLTKYNLQDEYECYKFKCSLMGRVKEILIQNGYVLKAVSKVGYYILKPNQIQSYTYRNYIRKPLKKLEKAEIILNNVKDKELKEDERNDLQLTKKLNKELIMEANRYINSKEFERLNK